MGTDELHQHALELKRYVDNQSVFVATEIKDYPVVAHASGIKLSAIR